MKFAIIAYAALLSFATVPQIFAFDPPFTIKALAKPVSVVFKNNSSYTLTLGVSIFTGTDIEADCVDEVAVIEPGKEKRIDGVAFSPTVYFVATFGFNKTWEGNVGWSWKGFSKGNRLSSEWVNDTFLGQKRSLDEETSPIQIVFTNSNNTHSDRFALWDYYNSKPHNPLCLYIKNESSYPVKVYSLAFPSFPSDASGAACTEIDCGQTLRVIDSTYGMFAWFAEINDCQYYWGGGEFNTWNMKRDGIVYPFKAADSGPKFYLEKITDSNAKSGLFTVRVVNDSGKAIKVYATFRKYPGETYPDYFYLENGCWESFSTGDPNIRLGAESADKKLRWNSKSVTIPAQSAFQLYTYTFNIR